MAESKGYHEATDQLRPETIEMHRAITSLCEELEAVDWYMQRIDASQDAELARVLAHNRDEEKEHACMTLEWIRRHDPVFDEMLRKFLFREGPIVHEEEDEDLHMRGRDAAPAGGAPERRAASAGLGIGSLREGSRS